MQIMKGKDSYIITYLYSLSLIHVHILVFFMSIGNKSIIKIIPETKSNIFFIYMKLFCPSMTYYQDYCSDCCYIRHSL